LQTPNAKPLDTSFGAFWQITQMQTSNAKPLEMLYTLSFTKLPKMQTSNVKPLDTLFCDF